MLTIAVIGSKASGKTAVAEFIIRGLTRKGYRVGAVKNIHHEFSIDVEGKDTWRFSHAGAEAVVGISPNEAFFIRKVSDRHKTLDDILKLFEDEGMDFVILEGFHAIVGKSKAVAKVLTAKTDLDLRETMKIIQPPILAVSGIIAKANRQRKGNGIPFADIEIEREKLLNLVEDALGRMYHPRRMKDSTRRGRPNYSKRKIVCQRSES